MRRLDVLVTALFVLAALALTLPRLGVPDRYFFDEILHAYTAGRYLDGDAAAYRWDDPCSVGKSDRGCLDANPAARQSRRVGKYEWTHPPLGKLVAAGGILLAGDRPVGWRLGSALAGALGVALTYRLGLVLTGRRGVAVLAAALLLADGLWFVESRLGVPDAVGATCLLGALLAFAVYVGAPASRVRAPLLAMGLCLGLALATKWSAAYLAVLFGLAVFGRFCWLWRRSRSAATEVERDAARAGARAHLAWAPLALGAVPAAVYVLAHVPFFLAGYGLGDFVELQRQRLSYHASYDADFAFESRWWEWPLALRPARYGGTTYASGEIGAVYALGNPLLFWAFLPAVGWVCWRAVRRVRREGDRVTSGDRRSALTAAVIAVGFFGQWLPWAAVSRPTFVYHFLPVVPVGCLAVAIALSDLWRTGPGWRRTLAGEYVVLVGLTFAFLYPFYAYVALGEHAREVRYWLPTWR